MDVDRESISKSLEDWKVWGTRRLPPALFFVFAAALGRWLPLEALIAIVFGRLFLIVLAQLLGTRSEPFEIDSAESDSSANSSKPPS